MKAVINAINTSDQDHLEMDDINTEGENREGSTLLGEGEIDPQKGIGGTVGRMKIYAKKVGKKYRTKDHDISEPRDVERNTHVEYDEKTGTFIGLPKEWEEKIKKQFGVKLSQVEMTKVE